MATMLRWQPIERDEHRVLAAIECVDATTLSRIVEPLRFTAPGARFVRNHSGLAVLHSWAGLAAHAAAFDRPPSGAGDPAIASQALDVTIEDDSGRYLARQVRLQLPRDPDPDHADQPGSLFRPQRVPLLRAAAAPLTGNWAALAISASVEGPAGQVGDALGDALGGALVEVRDAAAALLARGVTDWRGECVLPVAGIPVATWGDGVDAVVVTEIAASAQLRWPPGAGTRVTQADVAAGRAPRRLPLIDPDRLPDDPPPRVAAPLAITLAAARVQALRLTVAVP